MALGKLIIKILEADQLKKSGFVGHKAKPFVVARVGDAKYTSEVIKKSTTNPSWGEEAVFNIAENSGERLLIELKDTKKGAEVTLGQVTLNFGKLVAFEGGAKSSENWYPLTKPNGQAAKGRIRISMKYESAPKAAILEKTGKPEETTISLEKSQPMSRSSPPPPPPPPPFAKPPTPVNKPSAPEVSTTFVPVTGAVIPPPPPPPPYAMKTTSTKDAEDTMMTTSTKKSPPKPGKSSLDHHAGSKFVPHSTDEPSERTEATDVYGKDAKKDKKPASFLVRCFSCFTVK